MSDRKLYHLLPVHLTMNNALREISKYIEAPPKKVGKALDTIRLSLDLLLAAMILDSGDENAAANIPPEILGQLQKVAKIMPSMHNGEEIDESIIEEDGEHDEDGDEYNDDAPDFDE